MKKILSLLLAIFMVTFLVACNGDGPNDSGVSSEVQITSEAEASSETETQSETEALSETEASTEGETFKVLLSRGKIDGDIYRNEYLGFEFTKPASWVYATDEEIATALNLAVDNILGDNFKAALENNPAIYDMMVVDTITRSNINIVYENLKMSFATNITEEQYVEVLKQQLSGVSGMTVSFSDKIEKVKFGDADFTRCVCDTSAYGVNMTQIY